MYFMRKIYEKTIDYPWLAILLVLLVTVALGALIPQMTNESDFNQFLDANEPAAIALERAEATYGSQDLLLVLIRSEETVFKTETLQKAQAMEKRFAQIQGVDEVQGPTNSDVIRATEESLVVEPAAENVPQTTEELDAYKKKVLGDNRLRGLIVSEDGTAAGIVVKINPYVDDKKAVSREIERAAQEFNTGPEQIIAIGDEIVDDAILQNMNRDLSVLFPLSLLLIIVVLYLTLRSVRGVLIPLGIVLIALIWTLGTMVFFRAPFTPFSTMLPIILIAMGVADGIHVLHRFYEDAAKNGRTKREMILQTMTEMTGPVIMTSLTTTAGFLSLIITFMWPQRHFGIFTAAGMFYEMILSLVFIPAVLALLPLPKARAHFERGITANLLARFAGFVAPRKGWILGTSAVFLVGLLFALPHVRAESSSTDFLGAEHPVVKALDVADQSLGGSFQILVEIDTGKPDGLKDPHVLQRLVELQTFLESQAGVGRSLSVADIVRTMNQKFHTDDPQYYRVPDDPRLAAQLLTLFTFQGGSLDNLATADFSKGEVIARIESVGSRRLQLLTDQVEAYLGEHLIDLKAERVGTERIFVTMFSKLIPNQISSMAASTLASGLIVALMMGSLLAGLVSLIPLLFAVLIGLAVMVLLDLPLDLATVMVSSIAIGVGVDFAIHFTSRFRREMELTGNDLVALEQTMRTVGKSIVFNMLSVALGFAIMMLSNFSGIANFGLLITLTMVTSALATFLLIPALLLTLKPPFVYRHAREFRPTIATDRRRAPQPVEIPVEVQDHIEIERPR
jgi:predicted RND superfamily exporter protein